MLWDTSPTVLVTWDHGAVVLLLCGRLRLEGTPWTGPSHSGTQATEPPPRGTELITKGGARERDKHHIGRKGFLPEVTRVTHDHICMLYGHASFKGIGRARPTICPEEV